MSDSDEEESAAFARLAREVLATAPPAVRNSVSERTLVELAGKRAVGKYIRVDEYPYDRETVENLLVRMVQWLWSERRVNQVSDEWPALTRFSDFRLRTADKPCAWASAMSQRQSVEKNEICRLPRDDCWVKNCDCHWRTERRPQPAKSASGDNGATAHLSRERENWLDWEATPSPFAKGKGLTLTKKAKAELDAQYDKVFRKL